MSEYTTTKEGFQLAMEWALTGSPDEADAYCDGVFTSNFHRDFNGKRSNLDDHRKIVAEWRSKISEYKPKVEQFLRDGDQLSARMCGTIKVEDVDTAFETFMFGKVDKESGKLEYLIERSVYGPVDGPPTHGTVK